MKKMFSIFALLFITFLPAHAQTRTTIKKAYAFVQVIMPGTIMADHNGNPMKPRLNISRYIYIETTGSNQPNIESVQYNNETFKVSLSPITVLPEIAGMKKENGQPININTSKGNSLWKLELQSTEDKIIMKHPDLYKNIIIKEKVKKKYFKFIITSEIELQSPERG